MSSLNYSVPFAVEKKLHSLIVRVNKNDSAFVYFTLESNEGICFYSTISESVNCPYRDIKLHCTPEYYLPLQQILAGLSAKFALEILDHKIIDDGVGFVPY